MIPRLMSTIDTLLPTAGFFERLIEAGFDGDIDASAAARTVFATDNSIYQVEPAGIVFPKGVEDLKTLALVFALRVRRPELFA